LIERGAQPIRSASAVWDMPFGMRGFFIYWNPSSESPTRWCWVCVWQSCEAPQAGFWVPL
jgi:hypothetical protein